MSTPLPPELAAVERALEATRAPLPASLRDKVLSFRARPTARLSAGWFAAAVAAAAAVLLNLSGSASLPEPEAVAPPDRCALSRALHEPPEACLPPPAQEHR